MHKILATTFLSLLTAAIAAPAWATPFAVNPVRIYMTPKDKAVAVTITNEGEEALVMQADLYRWTQTPTGEDVLEPTEDVFLTPPIIKLAGKSRQVVRLARLRPMQQAEQLTYRMIVREIPEAQPSQEESLRVQIALAFSLPVFITPPKAKYQLNCTAKRTAADTLRASCTNSGTAYAQLINLALTGSAGEKLASRDTGGYILPTVKRSFDLKSEKPIPAGKAQLTVKLDDGSQQTFDITLGE